MAENQSQYECIKCTKHEGYEISCGCSSCLQLYCCECDVTVDCKESSKSEFRIRISLAQFSIVPTLLVKLKKINFFHIHICRPISFLLDSKIIVLISPLEPNIVSAKWTVPLNGHRSQQCHLASANHSARFVAIQNINYCRATEQ